jgi:ubiquinone/menaquinone biosynthesis C-methylase UbiE
MDKDSIRKFWDKQGKKKHLTNEAISSLEEDPILSNLRIQTEISKIMPIIEERVNSKSSILDLGGGAGQWALRFSSLVKEVTLVEFSDTMINLAIQSAADKKAHNISFYHSDAQNFIQPYSYDLIWISGLLIYLDDIECESVIKNSYEMLDSDGRILLRDGTGIGTKHEIRNQFSSSLQLEYSATYRTNDEYKDLFFKHGFELVSSQDMFENGSPLNKWKETRLRLYEFKKISN